MESIPVINSKPGVGFAVAGGVVVVTIVVVGVVVVVVGVMVVVGICVAITLLTEIDVLSLLSPLFSMSTHLPSNINVPSLDGALNVHSALVSFIMAKDMLFPETLYGVEQFTSVNLSGIFKVTPTTVGRSSSISMKMLNSSLGETTVGVFTLTSLITDALAVDMQRMHMITSVTNSFILFGYAL